MSVPYKLEQFGVHTRRLTDQEMERAAYQCVRTARVWFEEPRAWPTYQMFLGFRIGVDLLPITGGLTNREAETETARFIAAVLRLAESELGTT